jgi:hypothetical protein
MPFTQTSTQELPLRFPGESPWRPTPGDCGGGKTALAETVIFRLEGSSSSIRRYPLRGCNNHLFLKSFAVTVLPMIPRIYGSVSTFPVMAMETIR